MALLTRETYKCLLISMLKQVTKWCVPSTCFVYAKKDSFKLRFSIWQQQHIFQLGRANLRTNFLAPEITQRPTKQPENATIMTVYSKRVQVPKLLCKPYVIGKDLQKITIGWQINKYLQYFNMHAFCYTSNKWVPELILSNGLGMQSI